VSLPDFEINASLRGDELTSRTPPDPDTRSEGDALTLQRQETRLGLPPRMEPGRRYRDISIGRRLVGQLREAPADLPEQTPP